MMIMHDALGWPTGVQSPQRTPGSLHSSITSVFFTSSSWQKDDADSLDPAMDARTGVPRLFIYFFYGLRTSQTLAHMPRLCNPRRYTVGMTSIDTQRWTKCIVNSVLILLDITAADITQKTWKLHSASRTIHTAFQRVLPENKIQQQRGGWDRNKLSGQSPSVSSVFGFGTEHQTRRISGAQWAQLKRLSGWRWKATHYFLLHHHIVAYSWGAGSRGELHTVQDGLPLDSHTLIQTWKCSLLKGGSHSQAGFIPSPQHT